MARRTYRHIDFSPIAITLAVEENWPTLTIVASAPHPTCRAISAAPAASPAPRPSRKVTPVVVVAALTLVVRPPYKVTISAIPAATPTPQPSRMVISAPVDATTAPRRLHEASSSANVAAPTLASGLSKRPSLPQLL
ncbi:hypothetical protein ACLOJK_023036 [Asimina triloba]